MMVPTTIEVPSRSRPKPKPRTKQPCSLLSLWGLTLVAAFLTTYPLIRQANRSLEATSTQQQPFSSTQSWLESAQQSSLAALQKLVVDDQDQNSYDDDTVPQGVLSQKPKSFFREIQQAIDNDDLESRCQRYGFSMQAKEGTPALPQRRIFYGSLIADEPWEVFELVATESYGIFEGMVFVESNRTQMATPRPFRRDEKHLQRLKSMFGTGQIQIRRYINEDVNLTGMPREHRQRQQILEGWRAMGMNANDIGYIADADETFSRDFLRAVQTCPYVEALDYETHHCFNNKVKIAGYTRIFESSPECLTKERLWYHPDMIIGACIENIGNETMNPRAPRVNDYLRAPGFAHNCETRTPERYQHSFGNVTGDKFPLWSAADFRRQCGGHQYELTAPNHTKFTAYHFHNFFADLQATRRKYKTYGHAVPGALKKRLENIGDDLKMMVRCIQNWTDAPSSKQGKPYITETQQWQREVGGVSQTLPPWPILFLDPDYRRRKHEEIQTLVLKDNERRQKRLKMTPQEINVERLLEEAKEAKRAAWTKEEVYETALKALEEEENANDSKNEAPFDESEND